MTLSHFLILAGLLFGVGLTGAVVRRNILVIYMSLEMMLTAAMLALVAFSKFCNLMDGAVFCFFVGRIVSLVLLIILAVEAHKYRRDYTYIPLDGEPAQGWNA